MVDDEQYFLALVRYIHLNPVRARLVESVDTLSVFPWSGHAVLMGQRKYASQDVDSVLRRFASKAGTGRKALVEFMKMDEAQKEKKTFEGGGLRRSAGGTKKLLAAGGKERWAHDDRILGSSSFVTAVLKETENARPSLHLSDEKKSAAFERASAQLRERFDVTSSELLGGSRRRPVSEVRQLLCYTGCRHLGMSAPEVGLSLSISKQAVLKSVTKAEEVWEDLSWLAELG